MIDSASGIPEQLLEEIKRAIASKDYGSVEIYIEAGRIVQITERTIKKTTSRFGEGYNGNGSAMVSKPR